MFRVINPATEEVIAEYESHEEQEIARRLATAENAFLAWRETSFNQRSKLLLATAQQLRHEQARYARLMTDEMGKPISQAEAEIEKCAWVCEYYAEQAESFLSFRNIATDAKLSGVRYDPLGPVLAVMPWNFPFWQVFRFAAPALMAGNVGLLKHASNVPGAAVAIEEIFRAAGLPEGAFTTLMINSKAVNRVIEDPVIRAVTLTGSEHAGKSVASTAGRVLKKCVLELGGSDPFIVLADADLELAATQAARARCQNAGQSCIAAKRFIVEASVVEDFAGLFTAKLEELQVGDPTNPATDMGPMARGDLRDALHQQVLASLDAGARLLTGGAASAGKGYYYLPTLLDQVTPGMPAFDEETFGPLAAIVSAKNTDDAIALANRSNYGLGSSLWTRDEKRAAELAGRIEAGCVFINSMVKSDPRLPFGGIKLSGFGRELSDYGMREFVNIKTVWVEGAGTKADSIPAE